MLKNDRPIQKSSDDMFNRKKFAEIIAQSIQGYSGSSSSSFVFGISGEWGSGKTSTINMVKEILLEEDKDNFKIIEFSPWFFQGTQGLTYEFLTQFAIALNGASRQFKETALKVMELAQVLRPLKYLPGLGGIFRMILDATKVLNYFLHKNKQTVEEIKKDISEKIKSKGTKFLIIIDDIDRLSKKETVQVLMAIRFIADFENTFYLLAYDQKLLSQACDLIQQDHGEEFAKKIVQLAVQLPSFSKQELANMFWRELCNVIDIGKLKIFQRQRLEQWGHEPLENSFRNPRDIIRLINTYSLNLKNAKQQLDVIDLLYLTLIEVQGYELYVHIRNNKSIYTAEGVMPLAPSPKLTDEWENEEKKRREAIKANIESIISKLGWFGPISKELLSILFPKIRECLSGYIDARRKEESTGSLRSDWRLAAPECFDSYFSFSIPPETIGKLEMDMIIQASLNEAELEGVFKSFKEKGLLYPLFDSLEDLSNNPNYSLSVEQIKHLSFMLAQASEEVDVTEDVLGMASNMVAKFIENTVNNLPSEEDKKEVIDYIFCKASQASEKQITSYLAVLTFLFTGLKVLLFFSQETIEEYLKRLLNLFKEKLDIGTFVKSRNSMRILLNWQLWSGKDEYFNAFLQKLKDNKLCLVQFIDSSADKILGTSEPCVQYSINMQYFEQLGLIDVIISNASDLLNIAEENREQLLHPLEVENFLKACLQQRGSG